MQYQPIFRIVIVGLCVLAVAFLIFYIIRRARRPALESFDSETPKVMATSTNVEMSSVEGDSQAAAGDATAKAAVISACDMPAAGLSVKHYRSSGDIVDDMPEDNMYAMYLQDPSVYHQEVSSSSQLAMRGISNPYYEMNLSNVITGDILAKPDSLMSNDGSAYIIQNTDVTPPINPYISNVGQNGVGGTIVSY